MRVKQLYVLQISKDKTAIVYFSPDKCSCAAEFMCCSIIFDYLSEVMKPSQSTHDFIFLLCFNYVSNILAPDVVFLDFV